MGIARNIARLIPNGSGLLPNANIEAVAATKLTGTLPDANAPSGSVIQVQHHVIAGNYSGTHFSPQQIALFNQAFTPAFASSKVLVMISTGVNLICDGRVALTRDGQIIKDVWFGASRIDNVNDYPQAAQFYLDSPNTTNTFTYGIAAWSPGCGGTVQIGGSDNHSSWTFLEIAA